MGKKRIRNICKHCMAYMQEDPKNPGWYRCDCGFMKKIKPLPRKKNGNRLD